MTKPIVYSAKKIIDDESGQADRNPCRGSRWPYPGGGPARGEAGWGPYERDDRFAEKTLMPGLVEGHSHVTEGAVWKHCYVGSYDRRAPDGTVWAGVGSVEAILERLREAETRLE